MHMEEENLINPQEEMNMFICLSSIIFICIILLLVIFGLLTIDYFFEKNIWI
jgi:hypothetical protein